MGTFFQMMLVFGLTLSFLVAFLLDLIFSPEVYWRIIFFFPMILVVYQTYNLLYIYPYETPKYLLSIEE
jgi:hypothetical protein